jgi:hypothetical protein
VATCARLVVFSVPLLLASSPLYAQMTTPPPSAGQPAPPATGRPASGQGARPIFGGGAARIAQSLNLGLSIGETFFRTESEASSLRPAARQESAFLYGAGSMNYFAEGTRVGASAQVGTTGQYYSEFSDEIVRGYLGRAGGWVQFSPRTKLTADQGISYQPAFQNIFQQLMDPIGGLANDPATDVSASEERWLSYDTRVSLSQMLSRRSTLWLDYSRRQVDYRISDLEQVRHDGGFRFTHRLTAALGLRAGYRYASGRVNSLADGGGDTPGIHTIDAGVDLNKAFSVSRRTTLNVTTGSAVVKTHDETQFFVVGNATLAHRMLRTWAATLSGGRSVDFADGFRDPLVRDQADASLTGSIARRVQVSAIASLMRGREVRSDREDVDPFVTIRGGASAAVALARFATWTTGYLRQTTDLGGVDVLASYNLRSYDSTSTAVAVGLGRFITAHVSYAYSRVDRLLNDPLSPEFRRQSIAVSVSTSLPLFATVRK